jgi:membrane-bound lytic murein transglycosylase MltF
MATRRLLPPPKLRPEPLDAHVLAHARRIAANWRAAGLVVELVEHLPAAGRQGCYVLTARSPTRTVRCECRGWRRLGWSGSWSGTSLWSIHASTWAAGTVGEGETPWRTGVAVAISHDLVWRQIMDWLDNAPALPTDLESAIDQVTLKPAARRGWRPAAAALAGVLLLGAIAYGIWRTEPAQNEASDPATPAPSLITAGPAGSQSLPVARDDPGSDVIVPDVARAPSVDGSKVMASAWQLLADRFPAERGTYRGDLDVMLKKGAVRVLTAYSKTDFFVDKGRGGGVTFEYMQAFEDLLQKQQGAKQPRPIVYFVPVSRDRLIPALLAGEGDLIAANLTVTPERQQQVDFSEPYLDHVKEVVVTGPASPKLATIEDLAGKEVWVRHSSSYRESLDALDHRFAAETRPSMRLVEADEHLEDEDLLDMLHAGLIPLMVVDAHKANVWAKILPKITAHENIFVREKGQIAFAIRKHSPKLKGALNSFIEKNEKGTMFGNIVFNRYLTSAGLVKDASSEAERRKFEKVLDLFRRFGNHYGFDPLMLAAQGYQESQLDNSLRSKAGAVGIMQMLPATAKDPNVDIANIEVLENNIHAAAKYLRFMMDTFFPDAKMDSFNRTMFAFASYNAGPARIAKLRRQAASRGLNPDQWFGQVERVVAEKIGRETVQYISNILKYYVVYRRIALLQDSKKRALEAAFAKPL